jgi:CPA2 family monovalent cation:H+ antiporter-2
MLGDRLFLEDLALVLCVGAITSVLFRQLRQPEVLGYLLAGVLVGPYTRIPLFADPERIHTLSELGVILVMFAIGLEFSLRKLMSVLPRAGPVGVIQIAALIWLGYAAGQALGWSGRESIFAGAILSVSSTMIVARVLSEIQAEKGLAELVLGVLIVEDLAAILMLAALTALAAGGEADIGVLAGTAGRLGGFLLLLIVGGYLLVPRVVRAVARLESPETLLVTSVALCFACAVLAEHAGYSVALGAFMAGALVAESGHAKQIESLVFPLRDLFAAVFFVAVGMLVDPVAVATHWKAVVLLSALVIAGKALSVSAGACLAGYSFSTALRAGLVLPQIGEFSFILAGVGVATGAIDGSLYAIAVSVSVVTTFLTPWLAKASGPLALWVEHRLPQSLLTYASLYGMWIERLGSRPREGGRGARLARRARWLLLDALCLVGVVIASALFESRLAQLVTDQSGLAPELARTAVRVAAVALALPFGIGAVRLSLALGQELALAVLPPQEVGQLDLGQAPRRALMWVLQAGVALVVGVPVLALTQPFVPLRYQGAAVLFALALSAVFFWRRARDLEAHVRAGAELVIEALQRQAADEPEPHLADVQSLLPGLDGLTPVRLASSSPAVGRSLAALDLRARSGASVIAITREPKGVIAPTGQETLLAGDVLALAGSSDAIRSARSLLGA